MTRPQLRIDELFEVAYGSKFDFNKMTPERDGIAFVGRSGARQGVSGWVAPVDGVDPYEPGLLTVALGGASRLATFVQTQPFYTAQNVAVLRARREMDLAEKLYWATCIKANRFRYEGFGREANRTLATLDLPDAAPAWLPGRHVVEQMLATVPALSSAGEGAGRAGGTVGDLFDIRYGNGLELNRLTMVSPPQGVNFVSRTDRSNGVSARVALEKGMVPGEPGELTVALSASPLATFLQVEPFVSGYHVAILTPKIEMTDAEKLYWAMCIRANRYRYSYGRQANRTLASVALPDLPAGWTTTKRVETVFAGVRHDLNAASASLAAS